MKTIRFNEFKKKTSKNALLLLLILLLSGGQWAVIDTNYSRFALTTTTGALPTSTVQQHTSTHHHPNHPLHHHQSGSQNSGNTVDGSVGTGNNGDNLSLSSNHSSSHGGSSNSNSNPSNNTTIQSQPTTPVQMQYQTAYPSQIIAVNSNSIVNSYPPSISTPTSPIAVQTVYSQQSTPIQSPVNIQSTSGETSAGSNAGNNPQGIPPKRKRSVNPQGEENFLRALDAVRFGGIGFCKAARLYGVNNRTLWLEFKKRGYPISRPSIKSRIKTEPNMSPPPAPSTPSGEENTMENYESNIQSPAINMSGGPTASETGTTTPIMCPPHHPMGIQMGFLDTRGVEFSHQMSRLRYPDASGNMNPASVNVNLQGLNFNSM